MRRIGSLRGRGRQRGFTLIETMFVLGSLAVSLLAVLAAHVQSARLAHANHETAVATQSMRCRIEEVCAADPERVVDLYDADPDNDPLGGGTAPGRTFSVRSLAPDSEGHEGTIEMPVDGAGQVREDLNLPHLGMPRDLNGDGAIDSNDHRADYRNLPVLVRVRWNGVNGDREMRLATILRR